MFENEYTWGKAVYQGKQDEFNKKFDDSVDKIKNSLEKNTTV